MPPLTRGCDLPLVYPIEKSWHGRSTQHRTVEREPEPQVIVLRRNLPVAADPVDRCTPGKHCRMCYRISDHQVEREGSTWDLPRCSGAQHASAQQRDSAERYIRPVAFQIALLHKEPPRQRDVVRVHPRHVHAIGMVKKPVEPLGYAYALRGKNGELRMLHICENRRG